MPATPDESETENTAALLNQAWRVLGHRIVDGVIESGFEIRAAHSGVFAHIDVEGTRLTELARRANVTPQAMGELVDDLERMGYVTRVPDPTDRRAKLVTLTPTGMACVEAALATVVHIERGLSELLGASRLKQLQRTLRRIIDSGDTGHGM